MSNNTKKVSLIHKPALDLKNGFEFASINADCVYNDCHVYIRKPDDLIHMMTTGKLEAIAKSLQGQRMVVILLGEPRDLGDYYSLLLCQAQKFPFVVIPRESIGAAWKAADSVMERERIVVNDFANSPCPRLENIGGIQEKYWTLSHLQGTLKITSVKYIDIFWGEREGQPLPTVIAAEGPKYRYYGILYQDQNIVQDKPTIAALRAACESVGGMFRLTTEQKLRPDLHDFGQTLWGKFLADINEQFNGGK
jgi:hypothetical protein